LRKYGPNKFKFEILQLCSIEQLYSLEQQWIDENIDNPLCYNISRDVHAPMRGNVHSLETKEKISKNRKLATTLETRRKVGSSWRGKKQPQPMIQKRINSITGQIREGVSYPSLINKCSGETVSSGKNILQLAKKLGVNRANLDKVIRGKSKSCCGWEINHE
jgi:group I intron endonuclease